MDYDTPNPPPSGHAHQPPPPMGGVSAAPPPPPPPPPVFRTSPTGPEPRRPRKSSGGWILATIVLSCLLVLSLLGNLLSALFANLSFSTSTTSHVGPNFQEVVLEDNDARDKFAVINVDGVISGQSMDPNGYSLVDYIGDQLDMAADDSRVRAVLLKVDSPGGEVLASDEIFRRIQRFQQESGKPVIASMGSMAASGGYYISTPCRWIVANELTITGSIGVIMSGYNWRGLMDKVGVQPMVFKSGAFKDMLSPSKRPEEITAEEKQMVQGMVNETFGRFKQVVREGRDSAAKKNGADGRSLADDWEDYADGRILSGTEAKRLGFVDELGNFETAVDRTLKITGVHAANLIAYRQPFRLGSLFRLLGESESKAPGERAMKIDLGLDIPKLETGHLYFLPPLFAR